MWRTTSVLAAVLALAPCVAHADERDTYLLLTGGPGAMRLTHPLNADARSVAAIGGLGFTSYWGWTDTLHVGGSVSSTWSRYAAYRGVRVPLSSGSLPEGDFSERLWLLTGGALVHYRHDSGAAWAPFAQLELGVALHRRLERVHMVAGRENPFPDASEVVADAALQAGWELRVRDRYSVSVGLQLRVNPASLSAWQLQVPMAVGGVFR